MNSSFTIREIFIILYRHSVRVIHTESYSKQYVLAGTCKKYIRDKRAIDLILSFTEYRWVGWGIQTKVFQSIGNDFQPFIQSTFHGNFCSDHNDIFLDYGE